MTITLTQLAPALREFFASPVDKQALGVMGAFWKTLEKGPNTQVGGADFWSGSGTSRGSITYSVSQNIGSDTDHAATNSTTLEKAAPVANAALFHAFWRMNEDSASMAARGGLNGNEIIKTLRETRDAWHRQASGYCWQDGRGAIAAISAVNGTVITLVNPQQVAAFRIGDHLSVYDPAVYDVTQPGVASAARAEAVPGTAPVIASRNQDAGTLTLSAAIGTTVTGAVTGDYIGHRTWRPLGGDAIHTRGLYGLRTFVAGTVAEQGLTALGVNRADDPSNLAGHLITLDAGTATDEVMSTIQSAAARFGIRPDIVYAPTDAHQDLARDFNEKKEYSVDLRRGVYGTVGFGLGIPDAPDAMITTDQYLWDIRTNDQLYVATSLKDWGMITDHEGIGWRDQGRTQYEGVPITNVDGKGELLAKYAATGNVYCCNPNETIIVRVQR